MTEHILTTPGKSKKTVKSMGLGKLEVTKFLAWAKNNEKEIRNKVNPCAEFYLRQAQFKKIKLENRYNQELHVKTQRPLANLERIAQEVDIYNSKFPQKN